MNTGNTEHADGDEKKKRNNLPFLLPPPFILYEVNIYSSYAFLPFFSIHIAPLVWGFLYVKKRTNTLNIDVHNCIFKVWE
jgi:hypothetical protein